MDILRCLFVRVTTCLALLLPLLPQPLHPQGTRTEWRDLAARVGNRLLPLEELAVHDCPPVLDTRHPARVVLQYIENVFYKWQEYDFSVGTGSPGFCVQLIDPERRTLAQNEARVLLSASALWAEGWHPQGDVQWLDPKDRRLNLPPAVPPSTRGQQEAGASAVYPVATLGARLGPGDPGGAGRPAAPSAVDRPQLSVAEAVIGTDDRNRVSYSSIQEYPWNTIAYVSNRFSNGTEARATAFLVSPYVMLTNGHVVYDEERGGFVTFLEAAPAQFQSQTGGTVTRPFGSRNAVGVSTFEGYATTGNTEWDIGACFIDNPFGISTYMPVVFTESPAISTVANIAGYPGQALGETTYSMWHHADQITGVREGYLDYRVDTSGGQSGSPIWLYSVASGRRVIGVHSRGSSVVNSGARFAAHSQTAVEYWMRWTPQGAAGNPLNLRNGRFRIDVSWRTPDGKTGLGRPVALTSESGYFWFFNEANIELVVKVLEGRSLNGHFWVFYGALSDVEYTIDVTDTQTGRSKRYFNPMHRLASVADINAIPGN